MLLFDSVPVCVCVCVYLSISGPFRTEPYRTRCPTVFRAYGLYASVLGGPSRLGAQMDGQVDVAFDKEQLKSVGRPPFNSSSSAAAASSSTSERASNPLTR